MRERKLTVAEGCRYTHADAAATGRLSTLRIKEPAYTPMDAESRELLTVEQAANYLQLSQSSIRSYIRQGKLKAFRVAGKRKVLIHRDELLKLLEPARGDE